jgi:hypothetical protein
MAKRSTQLRDQQLKWVEFLRHLRMLNEDYKDYLEGREWEVVGSVRPMLSAPVL